MAEHKPNQGSPEELAHAETQLSRGQKITSEEREFYEENRIKLDDLRLKLKKEVNKKPESEQMLNQAVDRFFDIVKGSFESHRVIYVPSPTHDKKGKIEVFSKDNKISAKFLNYIDTFLNFLTKNKPTEAAQYFDSLSEQGAEILKARRTTETEILMGDWPKAN